MKDIFSSYTRSFNDYSFTQFKDDLLNSKEFRKEVSRVFSIANKRINRLDNEKLNSIALNILNDNHIDKFALRGTKADEIALRYSQAIAFLQNPTSTVRGAKEYINYQSEQTGLPPEIVNKLVGEEQNIVDYAFTITNNEYYEYIKGYISQEELLENHGFTDDVNNYVMEIEQQASTIYNVYLSMINKFTSSIPDTINIEI